MTKIEGEYHDPVQSGGVKARYDWMDVLVYGALILGGIYLVWYLLTKTGSDIFKGIMDALGSLDPTKGARDAAAAAAKAVTDAAAGAAKATGDAAVSVGKATPIYNPTAAAAAYAAALAQTATAPVTGQGAVYDPNFDPTNFATSGNRVYSQYLLNKAMGGLPITPAEKQWARDNDPGLVVYLGG